ACCFLRTPADVAASLPIPSASVGAITRRLTWVITLSTSYPNAAGVHAATPARLVGGSQGETPMKPGKSIWLGLAGLLAFAPSVTAQSYPTQNVRILVPFGAGSITDSLARTLADKLGITWKRNV